MRRVTIVVIAGLLTATSAACVDDGGGPIGPSSSVSPGPTTVAPSTTAGAATTTAASSSSTAGPTTTSDTGAAAALARRKAQAALDALPGDWTGELTDTLDDEAAANGGLPLEECVDISGYDPDQFDRDSVAAWSLDATADTTGELEAGFATVEVRVFSSPATASQAVEVLRKLFGSSDGRDCLKQVLAADLTGDMPGLESADVEVADTPIRGADFGMRLTVTLNMQGVTTSFGLDVAVTELDGGASVFSAFVAFGTPLDDELASRLVAAAVSG